MTYMLCHSIVFNTDCPQIQEQLVICVHGLEKEERMYQHRGSEEAPEIPIQKLSVAVATGRWEGIVQNSSDRS